MKLRKNKKGFSLVELMIVVVIMGILIAVAVPLYTGLVEKAERTACQANQDAVKTNFNKWMLMDGNNTGNTLFLDGKTSYDGSKDVASDVFNDTYLKCFETGDIPDCPTKEHHYVITRVSAEEIKIECHYDESGVDADHTIRD